MSTPSRLAVRPRSQRPRRFESACEMLEPRIVLASISWTGAVNNDWNTGLNWSGGAVPGVGDDVTIDLPAVASVIFSSGSQTVGTLNVLGDDSLTISGGSLVVLNGGSINNIAITGGAFGATNQVTLTGTASLAGNSGLSGSIRNEGTLTIAGDPNLAGVLENSGTILLTGQVDFLAGGRLNNLAGGVIDIVNNANGGYFAAFAGSIGFFNSGTFRHSGTGNAHLGTTPFNNQPGGVIEVTGGGQLAIGGGGVWEGASVAVSQNSILRLDGSIKDWTGVFTGSGAGVVHLAIGTVTAGASGATLNFPAGLFHINGNVTLNGGTFTNAGSITITADPNLGTVLNNAGTILNSGQVDLVSGGRLNNEAGALFDIVGNLNAGYLSAFAGSIGFFNSGTFRHSGTGNAHVGTTSFNNQPGGEIEVTGGGQLAIGSTGTWEGVDVTLANNSTLRLDGGIKTWTGLFTGSGQGVIDLAVGTVTAGASGATLDFPTGLFRIVGDVTLNGGTFTNEGSITITADPNLGTVLNNTGTILHSGQVDFVSGGRLNNAVGALFDIVGNLNAGYFSAFAGSIGFFNSGTFRHSGTGNAHVGTTSFNNQPGGEIEVTGGGQLAIGSTGTWEGVDVTLANNSTLRLDGGIKTWTGQFAGSGQGVINLAVGTITAGTAGANLAFPAGLFRIIGDATLNGGTFTNEESLTITADPNLGTVLINEGTILHSGQVDFVSGGRLNNLPGALFDIVGNTNGEYLSAFAGTIGFFNSGTFRHSGTGNAHVGATPFHNQPGGNIEVTAGELAIGSSGTWEGAQIDVSAGAILRLNGGTKTWTGLFTGAGDGDILATVGTFTIGSAGATLDFPAGLFEFSGNLTLNGAAFTNAGTLSVAGDPNLGATLNNAGTILHRGQIDFVASGRLNNLANAVFDIVGTSNGSFLSSFAGAIGFFNSGTFRLSNAISANISSTVFNNLPGGNIDVPAGTLTLGSSGTWSGADFHVATGATLILSGATKTWTGTFTGTGDGPIRFTSGTLTVGSGGATLDFANNQFELTGNSTVNGATLLNAGTLLISGDPNLSTTLVNAGAINLIGQIDFVANARVNNLAAGTFDINGSTNGTYLSLFAGGIGFFNEGTFRKLGAIAATSSVPLTNAGTVEVLGGTLTLNAVPQLTGPAASGTLTGGTWIVRTGATLALPGTGIATNNATIVLEGTASMPDLTALTTNGGSLTLAGGAAFTRNGALNNFGSLIVEPGSVLTVNGAFTQDADARLELQLGGSPASGNFGKLAIAGAATLGGTLAASSVGGFAPGAGDSYALITYASQTGAFATFEGGGPSYAPLLEQVLNATELRVNSLVAAADLALSNVIVPAGGFLGDRVTIEYTVTNLQNRVTTASDWTDTIYFSRDQFLDASDFLFARVAHTGGLGALGSYTEMVERGVPSLPEGDYYVIVTTDARSVAPDVDRTNNRFITASTFEVDIASLTLDVPINGTIQEGQDIFYKVELPAGTDVFIDGDFETANAAEFFVRFGDLPSRTTFDFKAASLADLEKQIRLLSPRAGTYFIMLHGREGAVPESDFTLVADSAPFVLDAVGQTFGANAGLVTIPLVGAGFANDLEVELRPLGGGATLLPQNVEVLSSGEAFATFDLTGVDPGDFSVVALQDSAERVLADAFDVVDGEAGRLEARLIVPERVRMTRPYTITVEYENRGGTDIAIPLLIVKGSAGNFLWGPGQSQSEQTSTLQFIGGNPDSFSAGVLRPGESYSVTLNAVTNGTSAKFILTSVSGDSLEPVDYAGLKSSMGILNEPPRYAPAFDAVAADLGATYGELIQNLARAADEARGYGHEIFTLPQAFDFLIDREVLDLPGASVKGTLFVEDESLRASRPNLYLRDAATDALFVAETFFDGSFSFFNVPSGTYSVEADGFVSLSVPTITVGAATPISDLEIIADPGEVLEGRIVGSNGRSVRDALVQVTDSLGRSLLTTTDVNGFYRIEGVAAGAAAIDISAPNFVRVDDAAFTLADNAANKRDFTLSAGGLITGRIVSPTGTPVPGAEVVARLADGSSFSQKITAGFDGRFRLSGLPAGLYEIIVASDGFGAGVREQILVGTGTTTPLADVALTPGGRVTGIITNAATGLPIAGAQFQHASIGQQKGPVLTNAAGAFDAANLTTGTFTTFVTAPGFIPVFADLTLDPGENETYNVALRPLGTIGGTVQAAGAAAAGLEVTLTQITPGLPQEQFTAVSGANGSFSFPNLPDGQYALSFAGAGGTVDRQVFTLDSADNTHTAALNLGGSQLSGVVRDAAGNPVAAQPVSLRVGGETIDTVLTDAQGNYRFLVFQSGPIDLVTASSDLGIASVIDLNVTAGQNLVAPDLTANATSLSIAVTAQSGGAAVAGAIVTVRATHPDLNGAAFSVEAGADGTVILPAMAPGDYEIAITKAGFAFEKQAIVLGTSAAALNFALDPGRVITGTARNADGDPVAYAQVTAVDLATGESFLAIAGADGAYTLDSLPTGSFDVVITDGVSQPVAVEDVITGATPMKVDAILTASNVSLSGVLTDASGDPVKGAAVRVLGPAGVAVRATFTDASGAYSFESLAPGEVTVVATPDGFAPVSETVTLAADTASVRDVVLGEALGAGLPASPAASPIAQPSPLAAFYTFVIASLSAGSLHSVTMAPVIGQAPGGDFLTGLQPPAPLAVDTPEFRFGFPNPADEDCPEQRKAHNDAIKSGFLVDQAFDAYESSFEGMKALNGNDVRDIGVTVGTIAVKAGFLLNAVGKIQAAIKTAGVAGSTAAFQASLATLQADLVALGNATSISGAVQAAKAIGSSGAAAFGLFQGSAHSFLGNIAADMALINDFVKLSNQVTETVDFALIERLDSYEGAQDRYLQALKDHQQNLKKLEAANADGCGSAGSNPEEPEDQDEQDEEDVPSVGSRDPNDILGPVGSGPERWIAADSTLAYTIRFENVPTATAAAQLVTITHQLDGDVDTSTFELGDFGFGDFVVDVPEGRDYYMARVDARDLFGLFVDVEAELDVFTGLVTWTFMAVDPDTLEFTADPVAGFLPPNITGPEGEGFVSYSIRAAEGSPSGTVIDAQATIIFDQNEAIDTPAIFNTLDAEAPNSEVADLPGVTTSPRFTLNVSSTDGAGSGIHSVDIYVSDNGGPFTLFANDFSGSSITFRGQDGHTYGFATVAKDNVGKTENLPLVADTVTTVDYDILPFNRTTRLTITDADGDVVTIRLAGGGEGGLVLHDPDGDGRGSIDSITLDGTDLKSRLIVAVKKNRNGGDGIVSIGDVTVTGGLGLFNARNSDLDIGGYSSTGTTKSLIIRDLLATEPHLATPAIEIGGAATDRSAIKARNIGDDFEISSNGIITLLRAAMIGDGEISGASLGRLITTSGAMNADLAFAGAVGGISARGGADAQTWVADSFGRITLGGALGADVTANGRIAGLLVRSGGILGNLSAASFGALTVIGGDVSGDISALAEDLGNRPALARLTVNGGDLLGDVSVSGVLGALTIKSSRAGDGGNVTGVNITASKIARITIAKTLTDSFILAGTDLGLDQAPGGGDDTFSPGALGRVKVGGDVVTSVVAAGLSNADGLFNNPDDSILGGTASAIAGIIVKGSVDDESYFGAGRFRGLVKFGTTKIDSSSDARFFVG